jgi:hypothetical protein
MLPIQLPFTPENVTIMENGTYVALMVKDEQYKGRKKWCTASFRKYTENSWSS